MSYDDWKTATPPEYDGQLSEAGQLRARIRMLETQRDAEHDRRVALEGQVAHLQVAQATADDVRAAKLETTLARELAYSKIADALAAAVGNKFPWPLLVDSIVSVLDHELMFSDDDWHDMKVEQQKAIASEILIAIGLDLAEKIK